MSTHTNASPVHLPATDADAAAALQQSKAVTVAVATGAAVCELLLVGVLARGAGLWTLLAGHAVVLGVLGAWSFRPTGRTNRYAALLWIVTASFGPLGPLGLLLVIALERHYARHATSLEEWHAMLFPPPNRIDESAALWRRVGQRATDLPGGQKVTPFLDVLAFGSVTQRQSVIAIIAQQFHPAFAPALKAALRDEHNVIRVQAATAIARLENEFLERTLRLETAVREAPDDADAVLALAKHYDDQAFTGLLDPTREQDCRVRAAERYEHYLRERPDDAPVRFRLARLQHRRGLAHEAEGLFRELVASGHQAARLWLMESLFVQGHYADLRDVAGAGSAEPDAAALPEVSATIDLWAGREPVS